MMACSESAEGSDWFSALENPERFYSDAVQYWEVGAVRYDVRTRVLNTNFVNFCVTERSQHSGWDARWLWEPHNHRCTRFKAVSQPLYKS